MENRKVLVRVRNLTKHFPIRKTSLFQRQQLYVQANDNISLDIYEGETFGLVGESGCGKTTLGRVILQLYPQTSGTTLYYGKTLEEFKPKYVKHVINDLAKVVKEFDKHKGEYEGDLLNADAEDLLPAISAVRERYLDALRIAGGLVLADDLDEVSQVLTAEYEAGVQLFPLQLELEDVTMKHGTLTALENPTEEDSGQLQEFEQQLRSIGPRREAAQSVYDQKHGQLLALRGKYADRDGFAALDAHQDEG
ncbi:MAG TPA: ATP-binding cassette domain-containing protein, partial [Bacillota bacterium]|nr:ATP-binding cassette domain-containing protein [Bacillota bacterium]